MDLLEKIVGDIETHDVPGIKACFEQGLSPNTLFNDVPLIYELTSEYGRGPNFKQAVRTFLEHGLDFADQAMLAVLADDAVKLEKLLELDSGLAKQTHTLRCAYTPLEGVTLLHICAEFNHLDCAQVLLRFGADVNAQAAVDEYGFGGQTPIFHTVNQNQHQSAAMLAFLLENGANLTLTVKGIVWGKSYPWETLIPAVNPISYAMMGLLPQLHRNEKVIAQTVQALMKQAFGVDYALMNVPNQYLKG